MRQTLADLRQNIHDARIYATDYELSETREEQSDNAKKAKKYLKDASDKIVIASQAEIFNAIDVAHLSAQIESIASQLK